MEGKNQNKTSSFTAPRQLVLLKALFSDQISCSFCLVSFPLSLDSSQFLISSPGAPQDSSKTRFNYISKKKKTREECKHDSFLSPDTSGQADNVLKQNKSALTVTSKSSARGACSYLKHRNAVAKHRPTTYPSLEEMPFSFFRGR